MKCILAFFLVFSLLLVANLTYARNHDDLGEYWKNTMKGQPMPEAIKDLINVQDPKVTDAAGKDHFIRDFDIRPNVILYHTHVASKKKQRQQQPLVKNFEPSSKELEVGTHD